MRTGSRLTRVLPMVTRARRRSGSAMAMLTSMVRPGASGLRPRATPGGHPYALVRSEQPEEQARAAEGHDEEHHGDGRGEAHLEADKREIEHVHHDGVDGVVGA